MTENQTSCIYDFINSRSKTLSVALENQKKINLYLLTALEAKNKAMRELQKQLDQFNGRLGAQEVNNLHVNDRLTEHENSGRHVLHVKTAEDFHD